MEIVRVSAAEEAEKQGKERGIIKGKVELLLLQKESHENIWKIVGISEKNLKVKLEKLKINKQEKRSKICKTF